VVTMLVTEVLQSRIFFSLFVGIPAGLIVGFIIFVLLTIKQKSKNKL
jgi:cell division protein FtsN